MHLSSLIVVVLSATVLLAQDDVAALQKRLHDGDATARAAAAEDLAKLGPKAAKACGELGTLLADKDPAVRAAAAKALGGIGKASFPAIRAGLQERASVEAGMAAIAALGPDGAELVPDRSMRSASSTRSPRKTPPSTR